MRTTNSNYFLNTLEFKQQEEYIDKEELLNSIREGLNEIKYRHTTGAEGITLLEFINEL